MHVMCFFIDLWLSSLCKYFYTLAREPNELARATNEPSRAELAFWLVCITRYNESNHNEPSYNEPSHWRVKLAWYPALRQAIGAARVVTASLLSYLVLSG